MLFNSNGKENKKLKFIGRYYTGYSLLLTKPENGWLESTDVITEYDLTTESFIPTSNTFYKHIGTTNVLFIQNAIYYFDGNGYRAYYKNDGTIKEPVYNPLLKVTDFVSNTYFEMPLVNTLFEEPSDWSLNYSKYNYLHSSGKTLPSVTSTLSTNFISNKFYYLQPIYDWKITKEPDGTSFDFTTVLLHIGITNNYSSNISFCTGGICVSTPLKLYSESYQNRMAWKDVFFTQEFNYPFGLLHGYSITPTITTLGLEGTTSMNNYINNKIKSIVVNYSVIKPLISIDVYAE